MKNHKTYIIQHISLTTITTSSSSNSLALSLDLDSFYTSTFELSKCGVAQRNHQHLVFKGKFLHVFILSDNHSKHETWDERFNLISLFRKVLQYICTPKYTVIYSYILVYMYEKIIFSMDRQYRTCFKLDDTTLYLMWLSWYI